MVRLIEHLALALSLIAFAIALPARLMSYREPRRD